MGFASSIKALLHRNGVYPRRWLTGLISYSRYLGYIRPQLLQRTEEEFRVRRQLIARAWEPRQLIAPVGKRILALCSHPDDESIGAGGLLLAHRDLAEIHLVCLCDGAGGGSLESADSNPAALVKARRAEFHKTAVALQAASVQHLDYPDGDIPCSAAAAKRLRSIVHDLRPDVVLLPWFLDGHVDHRHANVLYARACAELEATVLGYEIWSLLEPNAVFDITGHMADKLSLIQNYTSQLRTVDYVRYASGLANVRAYQAALHPLRSGAAEAFLALPNREYCDLVCELFDARGELRHAAGLLPRLASSDALQTVK
jgi:LmbE family N-acetylglucosaminyl deacetylase